MEEHIQQSEIYWPLLLYAGLVVLLVGLLLLISYLLGQRHREKATQEIFESGIAPTGDARLQFSSDFYLIAMFFVIFDLETVLLIAWAIGFEEAGRTGLVAAAIFIGILLVVLLYEWRTGALDYGPQGRKIIKAMRKKIKQEQ